MRRGVWKVAVLLLLVLAQVPPKCDAADSGSSGVRLRLSAYSCVVVLVPGARYSPTTIALTSTSSLSAANADATTAAGCTLADFRLRGVESAALPLPCASPAVVAPGPAGLSPAVLSIESSCHSAAVISLRFSSSNSSSGSSSNSSGSSSSGSNSRTSSSSLRRKWLRLLGLDAMPAVPRPHRKLLQQQQQPPAANGTAQTEPPPCTGAATQPGSATVAAAPTTNCSSSSSSSSSTPTGGGNGNSTSNTGGSAGSQNATSDAGIDGGGSSSGNGNATSGGGRLVCCCSDVAHPLPYRPQDDSSCCCGLESDCCAASDPISRMCTDKSGCGVVFIISGVGILCLLTSCAATGVLCRRCRRVSGEEEQPREAAGQPRRTAEDLECAGVMAMPPEKQAEVAVHGAAPGDAGFGASHECVICLEAVAVGPASWRTFPCHHGVCARCVDDIVRHNRRVMPAYNRVLHCPLCRKLAIVPEELLGKEMTSSVAAGSGGGPSSGGQDSAPATAAVVVVQPSRTELYRLVAAAAALRQLRLWLRR